MINYVDMVEYAKGIDMEAIADAFSASVKSTDDCLSKTEAKSIMNVLEDYYWIIKQLRKEKIG